MSPPPPRTYSLPGVGCAAIRTGSWSCGVKRATTRTRTPSGAWGKRSFAAAATAAGPGWQSDAETVVVASTNTKASGARRWDRVRGMVEPPKDARLLLKNTLEGCQGGSQSGDTGE